MSCLKILVLAPQPFFQNRGTPIATKLLAEELARLGHEVHLLVFPEGDDVDMEGVFLHRSPGFPGVKNIPPSLSWKKIVCDIGMFFSACKLQIKHHFDVIHAVEESVFMARAIEILYGVPYIYDMDSSLPVQIVDKFPAVVAGKPLMCFFEKSAVCNSLGVVAVCQALVDIASGYDPLKEIACLEDISLLEGDFPLSDENLAEKYGLSGPILLYVGNLEGYQGIDLMLEGFQLVKKRSISGTLVIIGGTENHIARYREKAVQLGISDDVLFCGPRDVDLLGYFLTQADILISPRIQGNNTPMKLYSYLDSGKVVLATDLPTHTQVLSSDFAELVACDKESMADGMIRLLNDSELREKLGAKGKAVAREKYSLNAFRRKLSSFYQRIEQKLKNNE